MDIYRKKKDAKLYIGVHVFKNFLSKTPSVCTMIDIATGNVISSYTNAFEFVGKIENGIYTSTKDVKKILSYSDVKNQ